VIAIQFEVTILFLEVTFFSAVGMTFSVTCQALFARLQKLLRPAVVLAGSYAFTSTNYSDPFDSRLISITTSNKTAIYGLIACIVLP